MSAQDVRQKHVLGLDLGQAADYTALEFHPNPDGLQTTKATPLYFVDFLHRRPLKTPDRRPPGRCSHPREEEGAARFLGSGGESQRVSDANRPWCVS
jgi:hypothetical protein